MDYVAAVLVVDVQSGGEDFLSDVRQLTPITNYNKKWENVRSC